MFSGKAKGHGSTAIDTNARSVSESARHNADLFQADGGATCVEANNHGILTCTRLGKDMSYPNFFTEKIFDKVTDKETIKLGFTTTVKSKPLIIDELRASMRECEIELNDEFTIKEMLTYIVTETGKLEAEEGCFDDTVIALALVNHIHEGYYEPIVNLDVTFPSEMVGDITGDLNRRRARVQGMDAEGDFQTIHAQIPLAELTDYSNGLGAMTGGQGSYEIEMDHYEVVPGNVQQKIIEQSKAELEKKE